MDKEIKSFGLAVAALPVALAITGVLEKWEWIDSGSAGAWSTFKYVVVLTCGCAYWIGLKIFADEKHCDEHNSEDTSPKK